MQMNANLPLTKHQKTTLKNRTITTVGARVDFNRRKYPTVTLGGDHLGFIQSLQRPPHHPSSSSLLQQKNIHIYYITHLLLLVFPSQVQEETPQGNIMLPTGVLKNQIRSN